MLRYETQAKARRLLKIASQSTGSTPKPKRLKWASRY
jgi:hypothetical protein